MLASLVSGALSGTTAVMATPSSRAAHARAWAVLPALTVHTPSARSAWGTWSTALVTPRSLKDPTGWRFSSFRNISAGAESTLSRTMGVRATLPAMRRCAALASSGGTGSWRMGAGTGLASVRGRRRGGFRRASRRLCCPPTARRRSSPRLPRPTARPRPTTLQRPRPRRGPSAQRV